ncbi:NAD(P)H-dependent oxidoreductase [Ferrimonas marina]|uniref:Putative NADPH-quinone reductase (Modulator of drug activity B) n=1 Tax=Ferrimonas marina TaxID=299255 RepID=A0A1M5MSH4_9GAMM|nr:NAD(P)H-dependent oxidoreductase [Ferrimonas marina]SHG80248.1 Putative NADPH-quinone reductase (modulator of drug activity B) [Ferrimonas marina]
MSNILVISGHPDLSQSYTNTVILNQLKQARSDIHVRDLASLYPDSKVDVAAEQAALLEAEVIVLQFPFYWYSVPGIMKQWMDDVLTYGFAYGSTGDKLKGKKLIISTTIGGPEASYSAEGYNQYTVEQLLYPLHQTAKLAQLEWQAPLISHGMIYIPGVYNSQAEVEAKAQQHAERLLDQIEALLPAEHGQIKQFVTDWFRKLDTLEQDVTPYLPHLADNVVFEVPEGRFEGHDGFEVWYRQLRGLFQPGCQHQVEPLMIESLGEGRFDLRFDVTLSAKSHHGESLSVNASEHWQLVLSQGGVKIQYYSVSVS